MSSVNTNLATLRRALRAAFGEKVRIARGHDGAVFLRAISDRFDTDQDPLDIVRSELAGHDLHLPERTLAVLKAPADLEPGEEELLLATRSPGTPTWADALTLEPETPPARAKANYRTIAFWGLKGGVGRTTALAHVATLLGRRHKVLAVDLDLDSPGLVGALAKTSNTDHVRFDELLRVAGDRGMSMATLVARVKLSLRLGKEPSARVQVLGPEHADVEYVTDLAGPVTPSALYRGGGEGGEPPLRRFLKAAAHAAEAEIVLLDARSGYSDEAAMAVLDLADEVIVFASPSPSTFASLEPAVEALERSRRARGKPSLVHFAAGMLPGNDEVRTRIVAELVAMAERVYTRVSELLETPDDQRPPHVDPVRVDYLARIVENDGTLLKDAGEGYREIAGRIDMHAPLIPGFPFDPTWPGTVIDEVCAFFAKHGADAGDVVLEAMGVEGAIEAIANAYPLVLMALCLASPTFAERARHFGVTTAALREGVPERIEDVLSLVWGERLDEAEGRVRTTAWLSRRLHLAAADPVLAAIRRAFEAQKARGAPKAPPLLEAASLREAFAATRAGKMI